MPQITVDIPAEHVDRIRAATAARLNMDVVDVGLPEFKAMLIDHIKKIVRGYEIEQAQATARGAVTDVEAS